MAEKRKHLNALKTIFSLFKFPFQINSHSQSHYILKSISQKHFFKSMKVMGFWGFGVLGFWASRSIYFDFTRVWNG